MKRDPSRMATTVLIKATGRFEWMEIPSSLLKNIVSGDLNPDLLRDKSKTTDTVDYLPEPVTYADFFQQYLLPNKACVLGAWATKGWRCCTEWVKANKTPNIDFLSEKFGEAVAPVANCGQECYSAQPKTDMTLREYLTYLEDYGRRDSSKNMDCLYLKDWHFTRAYPTYEAYKTPTFFSSDWLNEFWAARTDQTDDYRFVYMGPKGSWTPFHADVFRSNSWSANICGCKLWWLFPPGEEKFLKDRFGQLAYDLRSSDLQDTTQFPNYQPSLRKLEVIQKSGEVIFVPSGWHHQVFNLEDTISINHNWLNGCNIDLSWKFIKSSLTEVQHEISDCRDMDGWNQQCQLILKASSGIDYFEFVSFMHLIGKQRMAFLRCTSFDEHPPISSEDGDRPLVNVQKTTQPDKELVGCTPNEYHRTKLKQYYNTVDPIHALYDLMRVEAVVKDMLNSEEFSQLDSKIFSQNPSKFLKEIEETIKWYSNTLLI